MIERELNLHVPFAARAAVNKELQALGAKRIPLHARYFDTPKRELAAANIALRLRLEDKHWVQTIKTPGSDTLSRVEINHIRPDSTLDLSLYNGTPLEAVFIGLKQPLAVCYETKVTRLALKVKSVDSIVELAYDQGAIHADKLVLPIDEIEFEHVSGNMDTVFTIGRQWLQRHSLVIDLRSKAERGSILSRAAQAAYPTEKSENSSNRSKKNQPSLSLFKARHADITGVNAQMTVLQAYIACSNECLAQIIRNATFTAGVDTAQADRERQMAYVHQLRVGIRRLRSCWKLFNRWQPQINPSIVETLRDSFNLFGSGRDSDVSKLVVTPQLKLAGLPDCTLPTTPEAEPEHTAAIAGGVALQTALLLLLQGLIHLNDHAMAAPALTQAKPKRKTTGHDNEKHHTYSHALLQPLLIKRLNRWSQKVTERGVQFEELSIAAQHDLRKNVKTLRYCLDFAKEALPSDILEPVRDTFACIQQILGELNDFYVAEAHYHAIVATQPNAWFAIGWLRAMQNQKRIQAQTIFRQLAATRPLQH